MPWLRSPSHIARDRSTDAQCSLASGHFWRTTSAKYKIRERRHQLAQRRGPELYLWLCADSRREMWRVSERERCADYLIASFIEF